VEVQVLFGAPNETVVEPPRIGWVRVEGFKARPPKVRFFSLSGG